MCRGWDLSLWAEDLEGGDGDIMILADDLDCRSYNNSPVKRRPQQRLTRVRGALNRSCSVPDSNNPPCFLPSTHGDISVPVSDLTEIGAEGPPWDDRPQRLNWAKSCESYPHCGTEEATGSPENQMEKSEMFFCGEEHEVQGNRTLQDSTSFSRQEAEQGSPTHCSLDVPNNHMTKSMLCLNEESQDEVRLCNAIPRICFFLFSFFFTDCSWQRRLVLVCRKSFHWKVFWLMGKNVNLEKQLLPVDVNKSLHGAGAISSFAMVCLYWYRSSRISVLLVLTWKLGAYVFFLWPFFCTVLENCMKTL